MSGVQPQSDSSSRTWISPLTIRRLSFYLRCVEDLSARGQMTVSSKQLADALGLTDAQVRKDLAHFGQFGRPGVGYHVTSLVTRLKEIFGTDKTTNVAVFGAGSLGGALLRYRGFVQKGFRLVAAFDADEHKVGRKFGDVVVRPLSDLPAVAGEVEIRLAVLSVPAEAAQEVTDMICRAGIKGILNFAPVTLSAPDDVAIIPVDLAVQLEQLSYLVNSAGLARSARRPKQT
jgi:redox-sensing transcriptional repressor